MKKERHSTERKKKTHQKDREAFTQLISTMMIQAQNNLNQPIPQHINSGGKSVLNISTITDESTRPMTVSPVMKTNVPHRNYNRLITDTIAEKKVAPKRQQTNESGDRSKITVATTGTESQTEQHEHDTENGDKNKQNYDHQTRSEQQNH